MRATRAILVTAILISALIFLGMTWDSLRQMGTRTHADQLSAEVIAGKRLWQHYDCNDCHTILGIGGYYAPDVTKSYSIRGEAWLKQFLRDPAKMYPTGQQMPNFQLDDAQIASLTAYLKWVSEIDTNGWPPAPRGVVGVASATPGRQEPPGHQIFVALFAVGCVLVLWDLIRLASRQPAAERAPEPAVVPAT